MADPKPQKIKFIQACTPVLEDGEYRIRVNQTVDAATPEKQIPEKSQAFSIKGPRYTLDPGMIDSMFPIRNKSGKYGNCLPHIILKRKTLPWERNPFGKSSNQHAASNQKPAEVHPWLAVVTFDSVEAPDIVQSNADKIQNPEEGVMSGRIIPDTYVGESGDTRCQTIDVPADTFNAIMPGVNETPFLSHARYVDMEHKKTDDSNDGYFAVVIGNRLPAASAEGEMNVSHLVSLEGLCDYLPGGKSPIQDKNIKIRMITLANWQYSVISEKFDFKELLKKLMIKKGNQYLPATPLRLDPPENASEDLKSAMNLGYTAMNHHIRDGEETVSWYRGPFLPIKLDKKDPESKKNADALYKYDPETGMFDVSYAAAWQIGRLAAIKNKNFAVALFQWRRGHNQEQAFTQMREILNSKLSSVLDFDEKQIHRFGDGLIRKLTLDYIHHDVGVKLHPDGDDHTGLLGKCADPSGLRKNRSDYPGLLSSEQLNRIASSKQNIAEEIVKEALS
ncbi:MAG: hypothetical protein KAR42_05250 [candidate division Zixibacteria bacterium]|nr:hypothetical protein [candidate division Zixibacteria bacterium]